MLEIKIPEMSEWDEIKEEFVYVPSCVLKLEHSLLSISEWESKWHKAFLSDVPKTMSETIDYIRCMTLNGDISNEVYEYLTVDNLKTINSYIDDPRTATTIHENNSTVNTEIITSELIYYWMVQMHIPFECEKWHLNRLLTLIRVCGIKNSPDKKMSRSEVLARQRRINNARRNKK